MTGFGSQPAGGRQLPGSWLDELRDRSTVGALLLLFGSAVVAVIAYFPGLGGPLLLDDLPQLSGLIAESATDPALLFSNYGVSGSGPLGRSVSMTTFIVDAMAHGPDTWWWKYQNLLIHVATGLLLCWLTALLAAAVTDRSDGGPWLFGAAVAAVWLLHPLQVSTVLYTVQRMTELATLFVVAGLVCYVRGRLMQSRAPVRGWVLIGAAFGLFLPLAALSKESGLLMPVYCSLIEVLVLRFRGSDAIRRQTKTLHVALLGAYLVVGLLVIANFSSLVLAGYEVRDFSLVERVLTQFRVLMTYLSLILLPVQRRMAFFHDDIAVSGGLLDPVSTLISAVAIGALIFAAVRLRTSVPLFAFGILLFFASHLLESTIFPLELMFEHRNYLGLAGLVIAIGSLAPLVLKERKALVAIGIVVVFGLSALTWQRAVTWSSPNHLYLYVYSAHPESPRLNVIFSNVHASSGDFERARAALARVGDGIGPAVHGLFLDCLEFGRVDGHAITRATQATSGIVDAHVTSSVDSLTNALETGQCTAPQSAMHGLIEFLTASRARSPNDARSLMLSAARYLESRGDTEGAIDALEKATAIADDDALPVYLAAGVFARAGSLDDARDKLTQAFQMEKHTRIQRKSVAGTLYADVATGYWLRGDPDLALAVYRQAIESMPRYAASYVALAEMALAADRPAEASEALALLDRREVVDIAQYEYRLARVTAALDGQAMVGQSGTGSD